MKSIEEPYIGYRAGRVEPKWSINKEHQYYYQPYIVNTECKYFERRNIEFVSEEFHSPQQLIMKTIEEGLWY